MLRFIVSIFLVISFAFAFPAFGFWGNVTTPMLSSDSPGYGADMVKGAVKSVDTIAALRLISGATEGQLVQVAGYYTAGDGGGGPVRWWDSTSICTDNDFSCIDPIQSGGGRWVFTPGGYVKAEDAGFSATATGAENSARLTKVIAAIGQGVVTLPPGNFSFSSSVSIPVGVTVSGSGRGTVLIPTVGGVFINDFMFLCNNDGTNAINDYPNMLSGGISNIWFKNSDSLPVIRGILAAGNQRFENLKFNYFNQEIKRITNEYSDNFIIDGIFGDHVQGTDYQIEIIGLGDALKISNIHHPSNSGVVPNAIKVGSAFGGSLTHVIGGNIYFLNAVNICLSFSHLEKSKITVDSSTIAIKDTTLYSSGVDYSIEELSTKNGRYSIDLENITFVSAYTFTEFFAYDIKINNNFQTTIKNCFRKFTFNSDVSASQLSGILIANSSGAGLEKFNSFSYFNSTYSVILSGGFISNNHIIDFSANSFGGLASANSTGMLAWQKPNGTYYYKASIIYDPIRLIGRSGYAEKTIALTNGGAGAMIIMDFGSDRPFIGILRLYRGTSPGLYSDYIDVPMIGFYYLYDDGLFCNGYNWIPRAPSGVDPLNGGASFRLAILGDTAKLWQNSALPTVGAWTAGDYLEIPAAAKDANNMRLKGISRHTTGTAHVNNTDWFYEYLSTTSPAN